MNEDIAASFLDKTDWRLTLHRKLEACVDAEGTVWYPYRVKSLVSVASAQYPGWDAQREINGFIKKKEDQYNTDWETWSEYNSSRSKWHKYYYYRYLNYMFHHDVFDFIKNMCARKRMLLWGSKMVSGGTQMEYNE